MTPPLRAVASSPACSRGWAALIGCCLTLPTASLAAAEVRGRYDTYLILHRVGAESFVRTGDAALGGRLSITSRISDRGAVRAATTDAQFGPGLAVTRLESRREGAATSTALFAHDGVA